MHPFISLLLSINLYAVDRENCEELFKSAIYNFYLENSCKFNSHLSSSIRKEFGDRNCATLFSDSDLKELNNNVLGSSYQLMNKMGKKEFCKKSKSQYDILGNKYK